MVPFKMLTSGDSGEEQCWVSKYNIYKYLFPEYVVNNAGSVFEDVESWKELLQSFSRVLRMDSLDLLI